MFARYAEYGYYIMYPNGRIETWVFARYAEYGYYIIALFDYLTSACLLGMLNTVITLLKKKLTHDQICLLGMLNTVITLS